jgi:hypothetical protein
MERVQWAKGREMGTAKEKGKEQVSPPARKQAGKKADVKCEAMA